MQRCCAAPPGLKVFFSFEAFFVVFCCVVSCFAVFCHVLSCLVVFGRVWPCFVAFGRALVAFCRALVVLCRALVVFVVVVAACWCERELFQNCTKQSDPQSWVTFSHTFGSARVGHYRGSLVGHLAFSLRGSLLRAKHILHVHLNLHLHLHYVTLRDFT